MAKRLTIVVLAFNEEAMLRTTVEEILAEASATLDTYEVIIVNDGSTDRTGAIADELARSSAAVKVVHQPFNRGMGAAFYAGLHLAQFESITSVPGDNAYHHSGLRTLFKAVGQADLIIAYRANMEARTPVRRFLSRCCTRAMRVLTRCPLHDAHGLFVFPVAVARRLPITRGHTFHMRALSAVLRQVDSYLEVPVLLNPKPDASSGVLKVKPVLSLAGTMLWLNVCRYTVGLGRGRTAARRQL
jgi:dolichol-phosphate mannosyltransferase